MSEETPQNDDLKKLIESNARAIEALTNAFTQDRQDSLRERQALYRSLSSFTQTSGETHALMYRLLSDMEAHWQELGQRQEELSRRQSDIVEILKLLTQKEKDDRESA